MRIEPLAAVLRRCVCVLLAALLGACGGGGGGGSDSSGPALRVSVNGVPATAAAGVYAVKAGDTVTVASDQPATWSCSGADVALRSADITPAAWSVRIVNATTVAKPFTLSAQSSGRTAFVNLSVGAGDVRNGDYRVLAANGGRYVLALNFDVSDYSFLPADTSSTATPVPTAVAGGTFAADPVQTGAYLMAQTLVPGAANPARFRLLTDAAIGAFALPDLRNPGRFAIAPFVAYRKAVAQAVLDGTYNRFGVDIGSAGRDSRIASVAITGGGSVLRVCADSQLTTQALCPLSSINVLDIAKESDFRWRITSRSDAAESGFFEMAQIEGRNVYLASGAGSGGTYSFRIGLLDNVDWQSATSTGVSTDGASHRAIFNTTTYADSFTRPDGGTGSLNLAVAPLVYTAPIGLRMGTTTGAAQSYFLAQSGRLTTLLGAQGNAATAGYLQIGLID